MKRLLVAAVMLVACGKEIPEAKPVEGKRVIFIGLDGADWRLLDPLMADGTMPRLRSLVQESETRELMTRHPPLSPLVWTSMMTGVSPLQHRILDFTRFHPVTKQEEPITADERAVPAIWNMAHARGKRAAVFGMWATYPAEPGIVMTDRDKPRDFHVATEETHRRAMAAIRGERPDLAIVYFQGTDEIGHLTAGDVAKAREYFARIDVIVGEYHALARELDAELIIASDHGFDWGGAHDESSTATATAAKWHRKEGAWLRWPAASPGRKEPAHVDQVCSTLLRILGLPRDERLAPPVGGHRVGTAPNVDYRRRWRRVAAAQATSASSEEVEKLRSLGYLSPSPQTASATSTRTPQSFNNEGLILREAQRDDEAERAFREALQLQPDYASARQNLDALLFARGVRRLQARDCAGAVADLRGVSAESAGVWTGIAAAEGCLGNEKKAAEAFARAAALDPALRYTAPQ